MKYRAVGRTDLEVSALGLGGWLTLGDRLDERASHALLDAAIGCGITLIDLANAYANGEAERVVGAWLRQQDRTRLVITTKVFWPMGSAADDRGLGRRHLMKAIDDSLRRLRTDYIDIYFCHREDPETPIAETAGAMNDLIRQGKVRHWGTSLFRPQRLLLAHATTRLRGQVPPRIEQPPYNFLERWIEKRTLPLARLLGMGVFAYSPLANGLLTGKYQTGIPAGSRAVDREDLREAIASPQGARAGRFAECARRYGLEPAEAALAWVLRQPAISSALMGASSPAQLEKNARAADLELPAALLAELDALT